jgi:hypothetical protein
LNKPAKALAGDDDSEAAEKAWKEGKKQHGQYHPETAVDTLQ